MSIIAINRYNSVGFIAINNCQLFNKQLLTAGIQLERKVKQLELNLKKESDGRRKDKIVHDEEMKRLRSSVHLIR